MYEVISDFKEKLHDNHIYRVGKTYPANGYKSTAKRIKELSGKNNKYKKPFLGDEIEKVKVEIETKAKTETKADDKE